MHNKKESVDMKKQEVTIYITEDGTRFESEELALAHEDSLTKKHFESIEDMVDFFKETDDFKEWESNSFGLKESNPIELKDELHELGRIISEKYPNVRIGKFRYFVDIEAAFWRYYEPKIMVKYFHKHSSVELPEDTALKIYHLAYENNHSYGLSDTLDELDRYIEAIEIAFNKSQS